MQYSKKSMDELNRNEAEDNLNQLHFPIIIALDNVRSMNNVGSVFRTADALNISSIILGGLTPTPPHRDIQKTALGATESVKWSHSESLTDTLLEYKNKGYVIIGIEQVHNSTSLENYTVSNDTKYVIVLGNEVEGVSEEVLAICDECIEIPQFGSKHSMNIAVSNGIICWHFANQLIEKNKK